MNLTDLVSVKRVLRIDQSNNDEDDLLNDIINGCSVYIENYISRKFELKEYNDVFKNKGKNSHIFSNYPARSIIRVVDINNINIPIPSLSYSISSNNIKAIFIGLPLGEFSITYTAGYETIPFDIKQACTEFVVYKYKRYENPVLNSKTVNSDSFNFMNDDFPTSVKTILNQYKKVIQW